MTTRKILLPAALLVLVALTAGNGARAAELLGGPYAIAPRPDGATVCWQTTAPAPGRLRYRQQGTEKWKELPGAKTQFQAIDISGLTPGMSCEVEVFSGESRLGKLTFATAPKTLKSFTFYVYGDTRSNPDAHAEVARALAAEARRRKQLTFVVMTGDLADYDADAKETARQFFAPAAPVLGIMPVVPLRGNHECSDADLFKKFFPAPARPRAVGDPDDYFVDWGPVRVIILDQYGPARSGGPRTKWLAARLEEAAGQWRMVAFHEPMYSSGSHGANAHWRDLTLPIMRAGRVHAVFSGHDHDYERIKPQHGITQFVTGGGGAPLRNMVEKPLSYSAHFKAVHHFLTVEVSPEKLRIEARAPTSDDGESEVFDSVDIPRDCRWATATAESVSPTGPRGAREVLWGYRRNPWKMRILAGGLALLAVALVLKAIQIARRRRAGKEKP